MDWLANCPDLNPIEAVWNLMKKRLKETKISIRRQLNEALTRNWEQKPGQLYAPAPPSPSCI